MSSNIFLRKIPFYPFFLKILLFLALFSYFYPVKFKVAPISSAMIFQLIGLFLFLWKICVKGKLNKKIIIFYGYGILIFFIGIFSTVVFNDAYQFEYALTKGIYIFFYSFGAYLIVFLMKRLSNTFSFYTILEWMIYISLVQAFISFAFFFFPNIFEIYKNFVVLDEKSEAKATILNAFRLIGVGTMYATAAVQYGMVMWGTILLYKQEGSFFSKHIFFCSSLICLFCIAGIFSGRTFFVILLMTVFYIFFLNGTKKAFTSFKDFFKLFLPVSFIGALIVFYLFSNNEKMMDWAFELFFNSDNKLMESKSMNDLSEMYLFPDNIKTWLIGDGRSSAAGGGFYMHSDVGYIRSLFYWGLIGTVTYYFINYKFYTILKNMVSNIYIRKYFLTILLWFFIYNSKDFWGIAQYFVLYLMVLLNVSPQSHNEEKAIYKCNTGLT